MQIKYNNFMGCKMFINDRDLTSFCISIIRKNFAKKHIYLNRYLTI